MSRMSSLNTAHTSLFVSHESGNNGEVTKLIYENGGTLYCDSASSVAARGGRPGGGGSACAERGGRAPLRRRAASCRDQ